MSLMTRAGLAYGASSLFALVFVSTSFAGDRSLPVGAARWMARDNCAAYGPGFTSVEGTTACVRIGGHVRVEFGSRSLSYDFSSTRAASATTAAIRTNDLGTSDFPEPRHLRVGTDDPYGYDPFR
ncbi:MAG TPA: porin [Methylovirgula sp.]|nr:porin [Methylovirgula sp.]